MIDQLPYINALFVKKQSGFFTINYKYFSHSKYFKYFLDLPTMIHIEPKKMISRNLKLFLMITITTCNFRNTLLFQE